MWRPPSGTIEDQQLMLDEHRLRNYGTNAARPGESSKRDDDMNEKDDKITHLGIVSNPRKCQESGLFSNSPGTGCMHAKIRRMHLINVQQIIFACLSCPRRGRAACSPDRLP